MILVVYLRYKLIVLIILETNTKDLPISLSCTHTQFNHKCNNHLSPSSNQHVKYRYNFLFYLRSKLLSQALATDKKRALRHSKPSKSFLLHISTSTIQLIAPPIVMVKMNAEWYLKLIWRWEWNLKRECASILRMTTLPLYVC